MEYDQGQDLGFRTGMTEYKAYSQGWVIVRTLWSWRGWGFGFIGWSVFGPTSDPAHTLSVPKLGLRGPSDFSSEEDTWLSQACLGPDPTYRSRLTERKQAFSAGNVQGWGQVGRPCDLGAGVKGEAGALTWGARFWPCSGCLE